MFNLEKIVRINILNLKPYATARDEFKGNDGIFFDANENPFGVLNRYPDPGQKALKKKLSEQRNVDSENIFIGNGSDEAIDLAYRIFCEPGYDKALTFSPTYGMYDMAACINNIELMKVPFNHMFQINRENLEKHINDPRLKLIFICSPNNPSGNVINDADIEFILRNFKGLVFIDEAYIEFSDSPSWLGKISLFANLLVSQTFSKAYGLASARIGVAYSSPEIISLFNKVKPPYNVSLLNQEAALDALSNTLVFEANKKTILREKKKLRASLKKINMIKKIYPSDSNFLLVETTDANKTYDELVKRKIITRNRHMCVENCIRITVGTPEENRKLIAEFKKLAG